MANLMPEVAKLLGVELGEKFMIRQNKYIFEDSIFVIDKDNGLLQILDDGNFDDANAVLYYVLSGKIEIVKLPWEPKRDEFYYWPSASNKKVGLGRWHGDTFCCAMKALGMVYRTEEEAKAHMAEDYMKLTGKKLEG